MHIKSSVLDAFNWELCDVEGLIAAQEIHSSFTAVSQSLAQACSTVISVSRHDRLLQKEGPDRRQLWRVLRLLLPPPQRRLPGVSVLPTYLLAGTLFDTPLVA